MTLAEALRREADILRLMQREHMRVASHHLNTWASTQNIKYLTKAIKAQNFWEFNEAKIAWIEELLKEHPE